MREGDTSYYYIAIFGGIIGAGLAIAFDGSWLAIPGYVIMGIAVILLTASS